jgi:hypothetical protein
MKLSSQSSVLFLLIMLISISSGLADPTANGSSFLNAGQSSVNYTETLISQSRVSCDQLPELFLSDNSVLSAALPISDPSTAEICVVKGQIDAEIKFIAHLPGHWNGRFYMMGNGGYAGDSLDDEAVHSALLKAARYGFAVAFTNTGHDAGSEPGGSWAFNNRQKEIDFGYRAVHETSLAANNLINTFYGQKPEFSYFDGCSTGGLQGFSEAQRYPDDFDGILAGAPVFSLREMIWQYWKNHQAIIKTPLTREKLALLGRVIVESFDASDGVKDGVIGNPSEIDFLPGRDLPRASESQEGFSEDEIAMLEAVYAPTLVSGREIYPQTPVGGEFPGQVYAGNLLDLPAKQSAWEGRIVPNENGEMEQPSILASWFQFMAFETDNADLDWKTLNPDKDYDRMAQSGNIFNADNPDLSAFMSKGGKMLIYHGWADFGINPLSTVEYYDRVAALLEGETDQFLQLYLIPGMHHCKGGANIDRFDLMTPLINWVEKGQQPLDLVGHREENGKVTRTRPMCAYPKVLRYRGTGSIDEHTSFACEMP